jgi:hypothetical protein
MARPIPPIRDAAYIPDLSRRKIILILGGGIGAVGVVEKKR